MGSAPTSIATQVFPKEMAFQGTWRSYQSRLLERLDFYFEDNRLHVVAAPGSGKTILGLEVIRRINQPTLVLAPTITIRNQWVERLLDHFLPLGTPKPEWVSTDIRHPRALTVATYQALHSFCAGERDVAEPEFPEEESASNHTNHSGFASGDEGLATKSAEPIQFPEILSQLKTLVIDEAHHLRSEWWRTLTLVADHLNPRLVALTATPPYDVTPQEWQRYEELCGPIDAEVSVPELVLQGDLCPHQDYVYFSLPPANQQKKLEDFRSAVDAFVQRLRSNKDYATAVAIHPWILNPNDNIERILDEPEYLSSLVIYLNAIGDPVPEQVLGALGITGKKIPPLSLEWLEILLSHCLYTDVDTFKNAEPLLKTFRHELLEIGAIERRKVVLRNPSDFTKLLTTSVTKLNSIEQIVRLEAGSLGDKLRCVVLTDFIRKSELPKNPEEAPVFEDVGVVPIFETLRRAKIGESRIGVLSGSLVIVPTAALEVVKQTAAGIGIPEHELTCSALPHDNSYSRLELAGQNRQATVRLLTSVFQRGALTVLVGTKSLLGEGWDAPTINTLILASFVGSYVLSNQMRGRSIRIDSDFPGKTANIWHLVCIEPGPFGPGEDYELLARRCSAFAGVSATALTIENGIDRLGLGQPPFTAQKLESINAETCRRATDRDALRRNWKDALTNGVTKQLTHGVKAAEESLPFGFVFTNTIASLLVQAWFIFIFIFSEFARPLRWQSGQKAFTYLAIVAAVAAAFSLPWALLALWRLIRHGTPERSIRQIGTAVLDALEYEGSIARRSAEFRIYSDRNGDGSVYCWIGGGTCREQTTYLRALRQVLQPIDNPRYLLARNTLWRWFREDYFSVPDVLARKKEFAEFFARRWSRHVGPVQLVFTRAMEGRKILLRARAHSLAAAFKKRTERMSSWK